ncbi:hypothetical protein [Propionivibrio sp.]|uniref:hypothetical protein n=1 Tax=Propionivibrio sp. TaxID=2212460 RepID=UPI003BF0E503
MTNPFSGADFKPGTYRCPSCNEPFFKDLIWKATCLECYLDKKGKRRAEAEIRYVKVAAEPIEPTMLRRLLQCCHPDRHDGSEASRLATQWLLQQRGGQHG